AVRLALGVDRGRLFRQLLTEAGVLALLAALAATVACHWFARFVEQVLLPGIVWSDEILDTRVLAFTLGAAVVCILLAGIAPAIHAISTDVAASLKASP